jgi:integrase
MPKKRAKVKVGVDAEGKAVYKYYQYSNKREQEAIRRQLIAEAEGVPAAQKGIMFDSYAREWLKLRKSRAASTQRQEKSAIDAHLIPTFRGRTLASITRAEVQELFDDLGERYKYNTVAAYCRVVNGIFESAHNDGLIRVRPDVSVVLTGSDPQHRRPLTIEERKTATACDDIGILLLYYTGARISEAINITWADVDFVKKTIQIRGTKTSSAKREIPLLPELEAALLPMRGVGGRRIYGKSYATLRTTVEKLLPQITPHYMRHNFASLCKSAGVDVLTTSRWMGHSSVAITQDIYTHLDDETVAAEAAKLAASMQL